MSEVQGLTQGTPEWLRWRQGAIGSSDCAPVMGKSPYKTAYQLFLEKTGKVQPANLDDNFYVQRGHALEPEARAHFEKMMQRRFVPALFIMPNADYLRYSSDGYDGTDTIIEIKCLSLKAHEDFIKTKLIPEHYMLQVQFGLMVSLANTAYYISYCPEHDYPVVMREIYPDRELIATIYDKCTEFWQGVMDGDPPALGNRDVVTIDDSEIIAKAKRVQELQEQLLLVESELEVVKSELISFAIANNILNANFGGIKVQKIFKKGAIDYSKIESLKSLDLNSYRKSDTNYWKVTCEKQNPE